MWGIFPFLKSRKVDISELYLWKGVILCGESWPRSHANLSRLANINSKRIGIDVCISSHNDFNKNVEALLNWDSPWLLYYDFYVENPIPDLYSDTQEFLKGVSSDVRKIFLQTTTKQWGGASFSNLCDTYIDATWNLSETIDDIISHLKTPIKND